MKKDGGALSTIPAEPMDTGMKMPSWMFQPKTYNVELKRSYPHQPLPTLQNCEQTNDSFCHFKPQSFGVVCFMLMDNQNIHQSAGNKHDLHFSNEETEGSEEVGSFLMLTEQVNVGFRLNSQCPYAFHITSFTDFLIVQ